ncbi:MAG: RNA 2',3'-cyclic phosphodiesterase [Pseudomonadota bacterium]
MPAETTEQRRRVFFALWPDAAVAEQLDLAGQRAHAVCGGRRMRRETLHLTLAFIGDVPPERVESLQQAAAGVTNPVFTLQFDRLACWRHNRIAWAGCSEPPLPLMTLVGQLAGRLAAAGLPLEVRDFAAHVTLLRNAHCQPLTEGEPITWPVQDFVLVESNLMHKKVSAPGSKLPKEASDGAKYQIIDRWPLVPFMPPRVQRVLVPGAAS